MECRKCKTKGTVGTDLLFKRYGYVKGTQGVYDHWIRGNHYSIKTGIPQYAALCKPCMDSLDG